MNALTILKKIEDEIEKIKEDCLRTMQVCGNNPDIFKNHQHTLTVTNKIMEVINKAFLSEPECLDYIKRKEKEKKDLCQKRHRMWQ